MSRAQDLNRKIVVKHIHIFTVVARAYLWRLGLVPFFVQGLVEMNDRQVWRYQTASFRTKNKRSCARPAEGFKGKEP